MQKNIGVEWWGTVFLQITIHLRIKFFRPYVHHCQITITDGTKESKWKNKKTYQKDKIWFVIAEIFDVTMLCDIGLHRWYVWLALMLKLLTFCLKYEQ